MSLPAGATPTLPPTTLDARGAPVAPRLTRRSMVHGEQLVDDYFWLRERGNPDVVSYLEAENAYADRHLQPTRALQDGLYREMLGRIKQTDLSVPYPEGEHFYYSRTEEGKQYPIYCRRKGTLEAPEEVTLDLNAMAEGHSFLSLRAYEVNDAGDLLAYTSDTTGYREYTLFVKDLKTGHLLPDSIERVGLVAWAADGRTLFYTVEDETSKRSYRLYRHTLGTNTHTLICEETDEHFGLSVARTRSGEFLIMQAWSHTTSEASFLRAGQPDGEWTRIAARRQDREYEVDHLDDRFLLRVNDTGRNFRLVSAPVAEPSEEHWKELVPHRDDIMLEGLDCFAGHYVLYERSAGLPGIRVTSTQTGDSHHIAFPDPAYDTYPGMNRVWEATTLRYHYQSLTTPLSVFDHDMNSRRDKLLKRTEVLGGYDPAEYVSERLEATVTGGVRIPVSLVYRRDFPRDGSRPLLLQGYGAYGLSSPILFSSSRVSLLDRGFAVAIAHVRGGGELGKPWHDRGRMLEKMNSFTDFMAVAEFLIAKGYTSSGRLIAEGGSAGGLLVAAAANIRPDLFRAIVAHVPFVDVINTMLDATLPLTVGEYEEWGNPNELEAFACIRRYCPYSNLSAHDYPAMLVKTSYNDSQVMYWEPAKYVAKLRRLKTDDHPLLLVTNMGAGHGGASGRYDRLREIALDYAFMLQQVEVPAPTRAAGPGVMERPS